MIESSERTQRVKESVCVENSTGNIPNTSLAPGQNSEKRPMFGIPAAVREGLNSVPFQKT